MLQEPNKSNMQTLVSGWVMNIKITAVLNHVSHVKYSLGKRTVFADNIQKVLRTTNISTVLPHYYPIPTRYKMFV